MAPDDSEDRLDPEVATALALAARNRRLDLATAQLVSGLRENGIDSMLMKGPATARVLYHDEIRIYSDIDLLVSQQEFEQAAALASRLGFVKSMSPGRFRRWLDAKTEGKDRQLWRAQDGLSLELHRSFHLLPTSMNLLELVSGHREAMQLHAVEIPVPNPATVALLCLLHLKTGALKGEPTDRLAADLNRAIDRLSAASWAETAALAYTMGITESCVAALRERGGGLGASLSRELFPGVRPDRWLTAHLRTGSVMAYKIMNFRSRTWTSRLLWMLTWPIPPLRPTYSELQLAQINSWKRGKGWSLRDFVMAVRVAARPNRP